MYICSYIHTVYINTLKDSVKFLLNHYTNKKLYRITTYTGSVIVTEDHSLLNENKQKIKPDECKIGTNLLHWEFIDLINYTVEYNIKELIKKETITCSTQLEAQKIYITLLKYKYEIKCQFLNTGKCENTHCYTPVSYSHYAPCADPRSSAPPLQSSHGSQRLRGSRPHQYGRQPAPSTTGGHRPAQRGQNEIAQPTRPDLSLDHRAEQWRHLFQ